MKCVCSDTSPGTKKSVVNSMMRFCVAGGNMADLGELDGVSQWGVLTGTGQQLRSEVLVQVDDAAAIIQDNLKLVKGIRLSAITQ